MGAALRPLLGMALASVLALGFAAPPHSFLEDLKRHLKEPRHIDGDISSLVAPYLRPGTSTLAAKQFCIDIGAVVVDVPKEVNHRGPYYWCWRDTSDLQKPAWGKRELAISIYCQGNQVTHIVAITVQKTI